MLRLYQASLLFYVINYKEHTTNRCTYEVPKYGAPEETEVGFSWGSTNLNSFSHTTIYVLTTACINVASHCMV